MQKVLLLNPPGKKLYIRDLFCSKTSKTRWLNHPVDLVMLSGRLSEKYEVHFLDAIARGQSNEECLRQILSLSPDIIVWLTGVVSYLEDFSFMRALKERHSFVSVSLGDLYYENGRRRLEENPFIDAVLFDYVSDDIMRYLAGEYAAMRNVICRRGREIIDTGIHRETGREFVLPLPRQDLFIDKRYMFPFIRHRPFATVATDFGCPHKCSFCIMGTLGYKFRPVENVIDELRLIKEQGAREVFFADQTWGVAPARARQLCEAMLKEKLGLGWLCFTRVDVVDDTLIALMKRAGCHTIIFGVESSSEEILSKYNKCYTTAQIRTAFDLAHRHGIDTVGTFIMGLPEETKETFEATVRFAKDIRCDYFSFNIAVPRPGTGLRQKAVREGLVESERPDMTMDQAGSFVAMATRTLSAADVDRMVRRVLSSFYLRPTYILRRIAGIRSWYHFYSSVLQAYEIVKRIMGMR
jgi:radical SAM superfamily enzyme YgiQ (UPF0313 family)